MDELVKQAEAAGEAVKVAKGGDSKEAIKAAVDALVAIKEKITALDPSHPLALVDKAAKKKAEKEKKKKEAEAAAAANGGGDAGPSKNAQKAARRRRSGREEGAQGGRGAAARGGAAAAAPKAAAPKAAAPRAGPAAPPLASYFGADAPPLAAMATWVELSLSYPAFGDGPGLVAALAARLAAGTWLVGTAATLADACCWAAVTTAAADAAAKSADVARWLKLCESQFAAALLKAAPKASGKAAEASADGGCPPLEGAVEGKVVTRFPPEPSGYLHIGHAKAVLLNDYYARRYKGKLLVRFDDTNPSKEKDEYAANILRDLQTLGIDPEDKDSYVSLSHTSDHFDKIASLAEQLIDKGKAFMDDTPQQQMRDEREARSNSKHRDVDAKTNLQRFKDMREGKAPEWCLRAKIDMSSDNGTLRDPVMFRANDSPHHRTGTKYRAYPTYDLACPIVDSLEGVTHALRTTEYNDRDAQYAWLQEALGLRKKAVEGWDDPRFPTIQGVVRRGVSVASLRDFIVSQGASRNIINLEWDSFWALNKAAYEAPSKRLMAVEAAGKATLKITNCPQYDVGDVHALVVPWHPKDESMGMRPCRIGNTIYLEGDDAKTLAAGEEVVLMRWGLVKITKADGLAFEGEYVPDGVYKKKKTLSWLAETPDAAALTLVEYDYLIAKPKLDEDDDLATPGVLTPVSMLERRGFFKCDVAHNPCAKEPAPIRLIYVPDGKPQHKVPFSRLPSAKKP
ncbi:hypothetical protein JL721_1059 [Aureococcus anophagefferens]|nr:hypothetical protein JL721_1059 [Aureococcus anophagefferens]